MSPPIKVSRDFGDEYRSHVQRTVTSIPVADGVLVATRYGSVEKRCVILFAAGGQTRHVWDRTGTAIAQNGISAISVDHRGHGDSDRFSDGIYTLVRFAADVRDVSLHIGRPSAIVGASLGGQASLLAMAHADGPCADALVLVDVAPAVMAQGTSRIGGFLRTSKDGFPTTEGAIEALSKYLGRPVASPDQLRRHLRPRADGGWSWHWDPEYIESRQRDEMPPEKLANLLWDSARKICVPLLLVRGENSDILSPETARSLVDTVPRARLAEISGAGHLVASDRNAEFNSVLMRFLRSLNF